MGGHKPEGRALLCIRLGLVLGVMVVFSITPLGAGLFSRLLTDSGFNAQAENLDAAFLRVHVLDVGKADAVLLESQGCTALLDAGTSEDGETVADYLHRQGIEKLDYAIVSHPDSDHIGGMAQVLAEIPAACFLRGEYWEEPGQEAADLQKLLAERGVPQRLLASGESFSLGCASLTVLGPLEDYKDSNNNSLVLKLACSDFIALFCGDMEKKAEKDLLASGADISADFLKVAHHGSRTSTTEDFARAVSPRLAVVSVGADNNNLPRQEPLSALEKAGAYVLRTDLDGNLLFSYNGERISIRKDA